MAGRKKRTLLVDFAGITSDYAQRAYKDLLDQAYSWASAQARQQSGSGVAALYATLGLLPEAETEVVEAAYRALVKLRHPDVGGDPQLMARLNAAYHEIKKLRGKA